MSPIRRPFPLTPETEEDRRRRLLRLAREGEPEPQEPLPPAEPLPRGVERVQAGPELPLEEEVPPEVTLPVGEKPAPVIPPGPELPPTRERAEEREQDTVIREAVDTIAHLFPDMVTGLSQAGTEPAYTPEYTVQLLDTLERQATDDPDAFLEVLFQRGRNADTETLLGFFGWTPEQTEEFYGPKERADRFAALVKQVWPQRTVEEVNDLIESDPDGFIDELRKGGSTTPKSQMLRELGLSWEQVQEVWKVQHIVVPLDGHRELLTIDYREDLRGRAFNRQGQLVGYYNVTTREFSSLPEKDRLQEVRDAAQLAARGAWQGTKGFFLSTVPNIVFQDLNPIQRRIYGEDLSNKLDSYSQKQRDTFRQTYSQEQSKFEDWLRKHPEMQPSQRYAEGVLQHLDLLKDPFYWAYEFANIAPFTLASLTVGAVATVATGNPWVGLVAAMALQVPMESDMIRQELLANGMPEGQADWVSLFAGGLIGSLEGAGHFPLLKAVSPQLVRLFRREAGKEVARLTTANLFKKAARTGVMTWTAEVTTEVFQEGIANAAIKIADENRSLFENLSEIAAKSAIGMLPFAAVGAGASMVRVAPSETAGLTDAEKRAKGWQQDPQSKNWYAEALKAVRRGAATAVAPVSPRAALAIEGRPLVKGAAGIQPKVGEVLQHPQLGKVTVTDISDPALLGIRTESGGVTKVGRETFGAPAAAPEAAAPAAEAATARRQRAALNEAIKSQQAASERLSDALEFRTLIDTIERRELIPSLEQYPWAMDFLSKEVPRFRSLNHEQLVDALTPIIQSAREELRVARLNTAAIEAAAPTRPAGPLPLTDEALTQRTKALAPIMDELVASMDEEKRIRAAFEGTKKRLDMANITPEFDRQLRAEITDLSDAFDKAVAKQSALNMKYQDAKLAWTKEWQAAEPAAPITERVAPPAGQVEAIRQPQIQPAEAIVQQPAREIQPVTKPPVAEAPSVAPPSAAQTPVQPPGGRPPAPPTGGPPTPPSDGKGMAVKLQKAKQTIRNLRQQKVGIAQVKAELVKVIKEHLPLPRQGELLSKVKNVETQADLTEAIARVEGLAEAQTEKLLRADITKELKATEPGKQKGITVGRLVPEVQAVLDQMRGSLLVNLRQGIKVNVEAYEAARSEIAQNIVSFQEGKLAHEALLETNERLKYVGLHGMSSAQLQETLAYIRELRETGKDFRKAKREAIKAEATEVRVAGIDEITGGRGIKPGVGVLRPEDLAAAKKILDQLVNSQFGFVNLLDKLGKLKKGTEAFKGYLMRFNRAVQKATNTENMERERSLGIVGNKFKEIYGVRKAREATRLLNTLTSEDVELGTFKITTEEGVVYLPIKLTRAQMMEVYQLYKNPKNLETFKEGMHWTPEVLTSIVSGLSEQDIAFADWLQEEFYDTYYDKVNPFYREEFNIDMPKNPDYVPQSRDFSAKEDNEVLFLLKDQGRYASVTNRSLKARQQNIRPFQLNGVFSVVINHIVQMEHFMAWVKPMHELRRFFGNAEVRTAIKQYHSGDIVNRIDDYMNDFARGGTDKAQFLSQLDKVRSRFAVAVLSLKPSIGLQQIWTVGAFMTEMKAGDFISGFANFWRHPIRNYKWMMENSTYLRQRYTGGNYERDVRLTQAKTPLKQLSGQGNISEFLLLQVTLGDKFGVMPGWWAKYQAGLKEGLSQEDAMLEADAASERTQNTSEVASLSWLQRGSSWGKLLTMFQSQPNKYFRLIADNLRNMQYGRTSKVKGMTNLFLVWVLLPALFQLTADAFQFKKERLARVLLLGPLNNILVAGQLLQTAWGWFTDDSFDWQVSPVLSTVRDAQNFASKLVKLYGQHKNPYMDVSVDDVIAAVEFLAKGAGQLAGLPTPYLVQMEKALRGTEGQRDLRELVFSRWALEEPKPGLVAQADEVLEGLGLPIEEKPEAGKPLSEKPLPIFDMTKLNGRYRQIFSKTLPKDITEQRDFGSLAVAWGEKEVLARSQADVLPDVPLYKINTDDAEDDTILQYYKQWQARSQIKSLPALVEFDKLYPKAYLGNVTRRQYDLLVRYLDAPDEEKERFRELNPELRANPRNEWLKTHPKENAQLALWGEAVVLSTAAYDEFVRLQEALDIPDNALPAQTLPPKESVATHFSYLEAGGEHGWNSWEAQLVLGKDDAYREWAEMEIIKTPVAALELLVKDRPFYDAEASLRETLPSVPDEDNPDYRTGYQYAISVLRDMNPEWVDNQRRVDALKQGTNESPTAKAIVEDWVERGRVVDEHGSASAEALVWLADNQETYQWALDKGLLTDEGGLEAGDWNIPALRITIQYRAEDAEYDALPVEGDARANYLMSNDAYRKDRRRRDAYQLDLADAQVEEYVDYYELSARGYRQERWLQEHPGFYNDVWLNPDTLGNAAIDFSKVPDVRYDDLLEKWDAQMERYYVEIPAETRLLTGDAKSGEVARLRQELFNANPRFFEDRLRFEAYASFVPEPAVKGYVDYYSVLYKGKPAGWDIWWEDDRVLMENPGFFQYARDTWGWEDRDFDMVPSVAFERTYNTVYVAMRLPDGSADLKARYAYRGSHKDFDLEGVRAGLWKPHENRAPSDWSYLAPIIARIAR